MLNQNMNCSLYNSCLGFKSKKKSIVSHSEFLFLHGRKIMDLYEILWNLEALETFQAPVILHT